MRSKGNLGMFPSGKGMDSEVQSSSLSQCQMSGSGGRWHGKSSII